MTLRKFGHNIWDRIYDSSPYISTFGLIVLSIIDISNVDNWKVSVAQNSNFPIGRLIYLIIIFICLLFSYFSIEKSQSLKKLEQDVEDKGSKIVDLETSLNDVVSDMNELFNSYLNLLVANLNFSHNERISVYKMVDNEFIIIGRTSKDPTYCQIRRPKYPSNQGFISKAWREGEYFIDDLPDPNSRFAEYYRRINAICPIDKEVVSGMNLKSRTFLIYRLDGYNQLPKAVIVLESSQSMAFSKQSIIEKLDGVKETLVMFIEKNNGVILSNNNIGL